LRLYPACSGLEGVFLFYFLLAAMMLIDWRLFSSRRVLAYFLIAFIYMFFLNAFRITALFMVGDCAWRPDASAFAVSFRDWPLMMFHDWVGWLVYLSAFLLFAAIVYLRLMRTPKVAVTS